MNEKHYPDTDTDGTKKEQVMEATAQSFSTFRGRIGIFAAHILLLTSPYFAYQELTTPKPKCTASEMVCAFRPGSLGLPIIAIMAILSAFVVITYWRVR